MLLIYRGQAFVYIPPYSRTYVPPIAVNWRYQLPGETYPNPAPRSFDLCPHAMNWRYRLPC